jgi:dTDP-4-dehydrorhamnose 3,5-epimerase
MASALIHDVVVVPLRQIADERGKVMHMLREDAPHFERFGEIYFSTIYPGAVKAWHLHKEMVLNYAVPVGNIKLVLYDERDQSPTRGAVQELFLGPDCYQLVRIPAGVWNGFRCLGAAPALVANCATRSHSPDELVRRPHDDPAIPYSWAPQHG